MNTPQTSVPIADRIQQLVAERQRHADALAAIEQTLTKISALLGVPVAAPAAPVKAAAIAKPTASRQRTKKLGATQSMLDFIKQKGSPTSAEIRQHWQSEGRSGNGSPVLARLVTSGKVKRTPVPGEHGSRYSLAGAVKASKAPKAKSPSGTCATTAEDTILAFVKREDGATTREIRKHWTSEGRPAVPDYVLSRMVKLKKLKRTPLGGKLGSRFTLPGASASSPKLAVLPVSASPNSGVSSRDFVLQLVRSRKNPTTAQINASWKSAGRPGRANKTLGKLVVAGKLKRESVKDGRGSRYTLA